MAKKASWIKQFEKSLQSLQEKKGYGFNLTQSLDKKLEDYFDNSFKNSDEEEIIQFFVKGYINQLFDKIYDVVIYEGFLSCESPIEKMMFVALTLAGKERFDEVVIKHGETEYREMKEEVNRLVIEPQYMVGDYRVDFLVSLISKYPDSYPNEKGFIVRERKHDIIVECDGHNYHERTKEQAKKDKKRDRALSDLGFYVYRFTGSEIWDDPFDRAWQVIENLRKRELE